MWEDLENYLLGGSTNQAHEIKQHIVIDDIACSSLQNHCQDNFTPTAVLDTISTLPTTTLSSCTTITHLSSSIHNIGCSNNHEGDNIITTSGINAISSYNTNSNQFIQPKLENINHTANSSYDYNDVTDQNISIANLSIASQRSSPTPNSCLSNCQYSITTLPTSPTYELQQSNPTRYSANDDHSQFHCIPNFEEPPKSDVSEKSINIEPVSYTHLTLPTKA